VRTVKTHTAHSTVVITGRFFQKRPLADSHGSAFEAEFGPLTSGTMVGPYLIVSKVEGGGMGLIYRAHDTVLDRPVAIKLLPPHQCKNPRFVSRFRREALAQARLSSPNVVNIHTMMEVPAGLALVMEYLEGQTLAQRLRRQGPLAPEEAILVFDQALLGANDIHRAGVIHRDLKPSNIFITHDYRVMIMDFGIAKLMDQTSTPPTNALMGTLLYIPPEQINGRELDHRADIYTLGISLYEAVTGRLPFRRKTDYALMHAHVQENPPRPGQYRWHIPRGLERIILKAIEKEPYKRFQSIAEFHHALLADGLSDKRLFPGFSLATSQATATPAPAPTPSSLPYAGYRRRYGLRPHRPLGAASLGLSLIAIVAITLFSLGFHPMNPTNTEPVTDQKNTANSAQVDKYVSLQKAWGN